LLRGVVVVDGGNDDDYDVEYVMAEICTEIWQGIVKRLVLYVMLTVGVADNVLVQAVTEIDNKVFVVFANSSNINVYDAETFSHLPALKVEGLENPRDIAVCRDDRQLYVAESDCIWKVLTTDRHQYRKWLTIGSTTSGFIVISLSLTKRRLLLTSSRSLRQYHTTDKRVLCVVECPKYIVDMYHAIETTRGTFVVGHRCTSQDEDLFAVSVNCFLILPCTQHIYIALHKMQTADLLKY